MRMAVSASLLLVVTSLARAQEPRGIERIFEPGYLVEDRNGDGVVDFVNVELVLPPEPSATIVAAASDVAARLGFETMAMNLPLTRQSGGIPVRFVSGAADLAPGEGRIEVDDESVTLSGGDDAGLRAVAQFVAGRLPRVWAPDGPLLDELGEVSVSSMDVTRDGITRLNLRGAVDTSKVEALEHVAVVVVTADDGSESRLVPSPPDPEGGPIPARPGGGSKRNLDLSSLFSPDGLLGDSDQNQIADRIDAILSPADATLGTIDLAARLGLEAAGISIPLVALPDDVDADGPPLVLIGEHPALEGEDGALPTSGLEPGQGLLQIDPEAKRLVIRGGDHAGLERALEQAAERLPHIWERGEDRTTLDDIELDWWQFFTGRSPEGQAAIALYKLDQLTSRLSAKELRSAHVTVSLEKPADGFEAVVLDRARALDAEALEVTIDDRDVQHARTIFEDDFEVSSEVDDFWRLFEERVLPRARGHAVRVEAKLSEPAEVRREIESRARAALIERGAREATVRVLSAYKQGYSWLDEAVRPQLEGEPVDEIVIRFARYTPPDEWPQQAMQTPLRWLHEAFPIDEVLARELALPLDKIRFEMAPPDAPAYEVRATAASGETLFQGDFTPRVVLRPYLDRFRDYEMVNVTTGWLSASLDGDSILEQRIATDAERFWDHYQADTLARMYDYVMELSEGDPRGDGKDAPYFGELEVDLELSEPHEILGIDQEIISPMDALHEDVYFVTLTFFRLLGRNARGEELTYPGRVLPRMRPKSDGRPGHASIRFTGFATSRPAVVVAYEERDGTRGEERLDIPKVEMDRPHALEAVVRDGRDGIERLTLRVKVESDRDEREELLKNVRAEQVDDEILSAEQAIAMVEHLDRLREVGLYEDALAYHDLGETRVVAGWTFDRDPEAERTADLRANGSPRPFPDVEPYRRLDELAVQWDTPIPPPEAYGLLATMSRFPEATVYKVGESYLGKEVWAMDLMPPLEATHFSHDKATTLKPTVIYSARQHANEVSSTSHVLKLAELLLTDPEQRRKLDAVNVVIHPITNPDGAQLAYDLYRETPEFILHAGYLASLGMDVTSDGNQTMPIYPESKIRRELWERWRPDIFLNPHGYPSHQLVQLFSEFTGLVRRGRITERNWSMNKGWFMPGFDFIDDPQYPRHKEAAFAIRDYITRAIRATAPVDAMNQRNYDRYYRYGGAHDDEVFKLPMVNDVMIHTSIKGSRAPSPGSNRGYNPKVTIWSGTTEAPDETADGEWMKLVASAGLAWDLAILQYLVDGDHKVERKGSEFWGGVSWSLDRPRPPKPAEEPEPEPENEDAR